MFQLNCFNKSQQNFPWPSYLSDTGLGTVDTEMSKMQYWPW